MVQEEIQEAGEDLLTPNESPSQLNKDVVGDNLTRKCTAKMWSTKDLLVWEERGFLFWNHRLNYFTFIIPTQIIQEGNNTQESQKSQKTPSLCHLNIWEVPQESMEYQRQTIRWVHQEARGDQTQGHDIDLPDDICPTRDHYPSHWGTNS